MLSVRRSLTLLLAGHLAALALLGCRSTGGTRENGPTPAEVGAPATSGETDPKQQIVLAWVDGKPLFFADALEVFTGSHSGHAPLVRGEAAVRELAGRIVEQQLFLAEARALGIPEEPLVREAVDIYQREQAAERFVEFEVDARAVVTDEEVEAFYEKTDVALRIVLVETETREQAEELRARAEAGEDLEELAREYSIHESKDFGGLMPYVRRGELAPNLEEPLFELREAGDLTPVVPTSRGFAFARLEERIENPDRPPREVALPQIRSILEERRRKEIREEVRTRILDEARAEVFEEAVSRDALLAEDGGETIVARAGEQELTLAALREKVDLEAVRSSEPDAVARAAAAIAEQWAFEIAVQDAVKHSGVMEDPEVVRKTEAFEKQAVLSRLFKEYVYTDVEPSEEEVRAYYEANREPGFTRPPEARLAYVAVETREEAEHVVERVRSGENFATLAREVSIDPRSAVHGGRIGWVRPGTILPEVEEVVFETPAGDIAGPIETGSGWFVVQVLERREAEPLPYEVSRGAARKRLIKERQREAYTSWVQRLRDRADIVFDEGGIAHAVELLEHEALLREAEKNVPPLLAAPDEAPAADGSADSPDAPAAEEGPQSPDEPGPSTSPDKQARP